MLRVTVLAATRCDFDRKLQFDRVVVRSVCENEVYVLEAGWSAAGELTELVENSKDWR